MNLTIKVRSVYLLVSHSTDLVMITYEGPTSFPILNTQFPKDGYEHPIFKVEVQKGYGQEWIRAMGIPDDLVEVIDTTGSGLVTGRHSGS